MHVISGNITSPLGFYASGVYCGLRKNKNKKDLALIYSKVMCQAAAVYTTNLIKGAPLLVTQQHLHNHQAQALIVNSGNANTCNHDGYEKAQQMAASTAQALNISTDDVLVASTGVIGQPLNIELIIEAIPSLTQQLSKHHGDDAAQAILTTDTKEKQAAIEFKLSHGEKVTIGVIAKGSGMINPSLATMLVFLTTDIHISDDMLKIALQTAVTPSLNCISVDGDTSTNDMACIMANGLANNPLITTKDENWSIFVNALTLLLTYIARLIASDGEGATKLIECKVINAPEQEMARKLAKSVIMSNLVKSAIFGQDANWGRILCALGYANVDFDSQKCEIKFISQAGEITVCQQGYGLPFSEPLARTILGAAEITIEVNLNTGNQIGTAWGCDLTYEYVKINGAYRT